MNENNSSNANATNTIEEILSLDLLPKHPDEFQKAAIMKMDNAVVSAGAGSGKTEVLATRYACLIMADEKIRVQNILAITFTKKAAKEIYARVYKKLKQFRQILTDDSLKGKYEKELFRVERALKEFGEAKIQTLDSYSVDIVRLASNRYGIRPDFGVDEGDGIGINEMALLFVLKNLSACKNVFSKFAKVGKIEDFARTYFAEAIQKWTSVATDGDYFTKHFEIQKKFLVDEWNRLVSEEDDGFNDEGNLCPLKAWRRIKELYIAKKDSVKDRKTAQKYSDTPYFEGIRQAISNCGNPQFKEIDLNSDIHDCIETIRPLAELCRQLSEVSGSGYTKPLKAAVNYFKTSASAIALSIENFFEEHENLKIMYSLLDEFLGEVNTAKKISGNLSFKDIGDLALRILSEQKDIRIQQSTLVKKIMIDEFQDNNAKNKDLLYLVSMEADGTISKSKLFFVGDEKQSIYKFRDADVSVFNSLKDSLQDESGIPGHAQLNMTNNYRSDIELLKSFNILFGDDKTKVPTDENDLPSVFYSDNYLNFPIYEAAYRKDKNNFATKNGCDVDGTELTADNVKIHACILNSGKNSDGNSFTSFKTSNVVMNEAETVSWFIAQKIKEIQKETKCSFNDFAILDNSRTHRGTLQKFLTAAEIPYVVDVQKNVFSEGIANDINNFLRLCVYPSDSNAFASFLASPFAGLSMEGIRNIMASIYDKKSDSFTAFVEPENSCEEDSAFDISEDDRRKYLRAKKLYEEERLSVLSSSITQTMEKLWHELGYSYETLLNKNLNLYSEQFDLLYELARQTENNGKNISYFVDQMAILKKKETSSFSNEKAQVDTKDIHYPLEKNESVKIMTIHQSKGLEFPHVFITGIFDKPDAPSVEKVFFDTCNSTGISILPKDFSMNYFFEVQKDELQKMELAEQKRKIYVAVTRARNNAYLVGSLSEPSAKTEPSLMHKIMRYYYTRNLYSDNDYEFKSDYCEKPVYNSGAPFDFIKINVAKSSQRNVQSENLHLLRQKKTEDESLNVCLAGKTIEETENLPVFQKNFISPSGLEKGVHKSVPFNLAEYKRNPSYFGLNELILSTGTPAESEDEVQGDELNTEETAAKLKFTFGNFGTMSHSFLQNYIITRKIPESGNLFFLDSKILKSLDENFSGEQKESLASICRTMTENFSSSAVGEEIKKSWEKLFIVKAENEFRLKVNDVIATGFIDLFFKDSEGDRWTIVDYKTDGTIKPEKYFQQLACYRNALSQMYGVGMEKIRTVLYYLRYDKELDITEYTNLTVEELSDFIKTLEQSAE